MIYRSFVLCLALTVGLISSPAEGEETSCPCSPCGTLGDKGDAASVSAVDPNALTGPTGYGERHFIALGTAHPYRIDFENDAAAVVPAQQVDITNNLDSNLNWSRFQITEIGFGDTFIAVPPGNFEFTTTVPMTYQGVSFDVRINAGIDKSTGQVSAHFYSIDPATGLPPSVEIGFLPPEDETGRGMGHISYLIDHQKDVTEFAEIRNVALIVFDMGEEIYTNQIDPHDPSQGTDPEKEALVTIDVNPPASSFVHIEQMDDATYNMVWGGYDSGSDVAGYDIYYRNSGKTEWQLWLDDTQETSGEFTGTPGQSYEFRIVSTDNVGHTEQKDLVPDTKLSVPGPIDSDNDSIVDSEDNCPAKANDDQVDLDGDGSGDLCDNDDDGDGVADSTDNCPRNANTGQADLDNDSQGDVCDTDDDGDNVSDEIDNCPVVSNADQSNLDGDGLGDICDPDDDNDGVADTADNCSALSNPQQSDLDEDGLGDLCDEDKDGDAVANQEDNCPLLANSAQDDHDVDGLGNVCDPDDDNDEIIDVDDNCPVDANSDQADLDEDGLGNICDFDDDGDEIADTVDNCPTTSNADQDDVDTDGLGDACDEDKDGDGLVNNDDNCPVLVNPDQQDLDGDGVGDLCDPDADGDQIVNAEDNCPITPNTDQMDTDNDGVGSLCDACPEDAENDSDGDGVCGNIDNCPTLANEDQGDGDEDGLGDLCDPQTCGNSILEAAELCDDGNFVNGDGCSTTCIFETRLIISRAKVDWKKGSVTFSGHTALPPGILPVNISPQSTVSIQIGDLEPVIAETVDFKVRGKKQKVWTARKVGHLGSVVAEKGHFKGKGKKKKGSTAHKTARKKGLLKGYKINWLGSIFVYNGPVQIEAGYLDHKSSSIVLSRGDYQGEFSLMIGNSTIHVAEDDTVTTTPAVDEVHVDEDGEIELDIPEPLTVGTIMVLSRPGHEDIHIPIEEGSAIANGRFKLKADFDTQGQSGLDVPTELRLELSLGEKSYSSYFKIDSGWKVIRAKKWQYAPERQ